MKKQNDNHSIVRSECENGIKTTISTPEGIIIIDGDTLTFKGKGQVFLYPQKWYLLTYLDNIQLLKRPLFLLLRILCYFKYKYQNFKF